MINIAYYLFKNIKLCNEGKLHFLMFLACIEYYKKYKLKLFEENFEAWTRGPIIREFHFYKLLLPTTKIENIKSRKIKKILDNIIKKYGNYGYFDLANLVIENKSYKNARIGIDKFENVTNIIDFTKE